MDPYLWTWLARYGGACLLVPLWAATALHAGFRRRWVSAGAFGALALVTGSALATHLGPLLVGAPIPDDAGALVVAAGAPFVVFAGLGLLRRPPQGGFDLLTFAPAALVPFGWPAWLLSIVLVGRGWLFAGNVRSALLAGILVLGAAAGVDHVRADLRDAARAQGLGADHAVQVVSAATGGLEALGWAAMTGWAVREARGSRDPDTRRAGGSA